MDVAKGNRGQPDPPGQRARKPLSTRLYFLSGNGRPSMAHVKQASRRKRGRTALPVLGAASVSLTMLGGASASAVPTANVPSKGAAPHPAIVLGEEEIFDVSLATFYVFNRENAGALKVAARACGGCRGCGGCAGRGCAARGCAGAALGCRGCVSCRGCVGCRSCGGWGGCGGCGCACVGWGIGIIAPALAGCCMSWGACRLC